MSIDALSLNVTNAGVAIHAPARQASVSFRAMPEAAANADRYMESAQASEADYGPRLKAQAAQHVFRSKSSVETNASAAPAPSAICRAEPMDALQQARIEGLKHQDERVRRHEEAHLAAGAHGVSYRMVMGPDGRAYAVGGHAFVPTVNLSFSPEEIIVKAQLAKRVALAPVDPSSQDLRVAADADRAIKQAQLEIQSRNSLVPSLMAQSDGSVLSLIGALRTFVHIDPQPRPMGGAGAAG